ncbi:plasmid replication protein RepC [Chachezhania sediminis]|uniref:plasmid replication protein RepC n=1 Tax=Chachezhania sediminis TaxID=2599291 RepID=UPI00131AF276|nr:plasmid replication protein RepC [Chachezhania sediminis]
MAFKRIPLPGTRPADRSACADPKSTAWDILRAVRDARSILGLRAGHVQTLQAMISFLKPGQGVVVFASNIELCRRAGGIDERTLRRHIERLATLDLLDRQDSPNGKRYRVRSTDGSGASFGLSLAPLFARAERLIALAQQVEDDRRTGRCLRKVLLARLARIEDVNGETEATAAIRKTLRRALAPDDYRAMLDALPSVPAEQSEPTVLPANDGQTVRHQSKSEQETQDSEPSVETGTTCSLQQIVETCHEAVAFSTGPLRSWTDVVNHATGLSSMMGIDPNTYRQATRRLGETRASLTVFLLLQLGGHIRNLPAYFQSVTLGKRADSFDPAALLHRMAQA